MKFIDLEKQQQRIREGIERRIRKVLDHGKYIMGPEVDELEEQLADYVGVKHCVTCANGTDALLLSLMSYGIGPGDAILTTPFTFIATAEVIALLGATPVFVDIDEKTFNISPEKLESCLKLFSKGILPSGKPVGSLKAKGVIAVDLFGLPADYTALQKVTAANKLFLVEDGAQSFGATHYGQKTGSLGEISTTSFFPAKPFGCYGDGGAVFTNNNETAEVIRSLRIHGKGSDKYDNIRVGINGRLDTIQAAILLEKFTLFPEEIELRHLIATRYTSLLSSLLSTPFVPDSLTSAWAQYSVITNDREPFIDRLNNAGVPSMVYYPKPLHLQKAFSYLEYTSGTLPVSEYTSSHIFSLPIHPYLREEEQVKVFDVLSAM